MIAENECLQLDIKLRFTTCCKSAQREMEHTDFDNSTSYYIICFWFIVHNCTEVQVNFSKTFQFTLYSRGSLTPPPLPHIVSLCLNLITCVIRYSRQDRTRWDEMGRDGMRWDEKGRDEIGQDGTRWDEIE